MSNMFREFISVEEAVSFGSKYFSNWLKEFQLGGEWRHYEVPSIAPHLIDNQECIDRLNQEYTVFSAFAQYCGGNYGLAINQFCRRGYSDFSFKLESLKERILIMDEEFKKFEIKENIVAFRTFTYKDFLKVQEKNRIGKGDVVVDKGFMGLGLVREALLSEHNYDTIMKVLVPVGCHAIYLDLISNRRNEQELLLQRNTRLMVLSNRVSILNKHRYMTCVVLL